MYILWLAKMPTKVLLSQVSYIYCTASDCTVPNHHPPHTMSQCMTTGDTCQYLNTLSQLSYSTTLFLCTHVYRGYLEIQRHPFHPLLQATSSSGEVGKATYRLTVDLPSCEPLHEAFQLLRHPLPEGSVYKKSSPRRAERPFLLPTTPPC